MAMSSWVPLRTAPSEPLCLPSTSYAAVGTLNCKARLRERRCGGQTYRGRSVQRICCRALQALHSYHNAYKLLHQPDRMAKPSPAPDPASQLHKARSRRQSQFTEPSATPPPTKPAQPPPLLQPLGTAAAISPPAHPLDHSPSPDSSTTPTTITNTATAATGGFAPELEDLRPYIPHTVSLPHWQPPPTSLQHRTALTRAITTCPTYTRLHQLVLDNAADFNCYHTCAALSRVLALHGAGLTPRESRLFKEGCSTLQVILRRQVSELQPRAVVVAAYSLARLELHDRELLGALAVAVEPQLGALQPQGLSSLLWAFARQNHQPPPKWMDALLSACAADLTAFAPRDMATVLWALARLHYKVAPPRLKQLLEHTQATLGSFCGRSLSNVVYSLALSQQHPGAEWLEAAQTRAVELGPDAFSPQGITQMSWGLAKLGGPPTPAFLGLMVEHASQRLPLSPQDRLRQERERERGEDRAQLQLQQQHQLEAGRSRGGSGMEGGGSSSSASRQRRGGRYSGLDLATLMYALASMGVQPRADLGRRLLAAVQWELPSLEANGMCNCLWACARLRLFPTKMWLSAFFDASYRQLPYFKPVDLSQTLWALARLQAVPPPAWMTSVMVRLQLSASMFSPVEVATTMWALARLGVRGEQMPGEVLALFFIATDRRLSSFKPQELSSMIWALAHMRRRPDKEWTAEFLKVTYHRLALMNGWCLATLAWSLAELSLLPPPAWVYNYVNAARALLKASSAPPQEQQQQLQAAAATSVAASTAVAAAAGGLESSAPAAMAASGLSAMDLGQIITALRRLNGCGGGKGSGGSSSGSGGLAKVDEFLREAEQHLAAMEAGSAAYARQQLGAFLAMSPEQAGRPAAVVVPPGPGSDSETDGGMSTAGLKGPRPSRRRQRRAAAAPEPLHPAEKWGGRGAVVGKRMAAAAAAIALGRGAEAAASNGTTGIDIHQGQPASTAPPSARSGCGNAVVAGATAAAAAAATATAGSVASADAAAANWRSSEVTRVLRGGARVTLAVPADLHLDLGGDLAVELPAPPSGPVLWRPDTTLAGPSGKAVAVGAIAGKSDGRNGGGGGGSGADNATVAAAGGDGDVSSSMAEIKRRLLAV